MEHNDALLNNLVELAGKLSVKVVFSNLKDDEFVIESGLCSLKGDTLIIIDSRASIENKIDTLCIELKKFNLEDIFVPPALRKALEK